MKQTYLPLKYAKYLNLTELKDQLDFMVKLFLPNDDIHARCIREELKSATAEDLMDMCNDPRFLTKAYRGPSPQIHQFLESNEDIKKVFKEMQDGNASDYRSDIKDMISMNALLDIWSQNKQVYEFDPDFMSALSKTDHLKLYPSLLRRLPYNTFYIDFTKYDRFQPFCGAFIHIMVKENDDVIIMVHRIIGDIFYTCYTFLTEKERSCENGISYYDYSRNKLMYRKFVPLSNFTKRVLSEDSVSEREELFLNDNFPDIIMFIMQSLMYLSSKEPDITENPKSKKTYKPQKEIRNKYSEIRKWDVGVRYGNKIRLCKTEIHQEEQETVSVSGQNRKSPRPHSRCAHWSHYWTGPGRKVLEVRWIEPTFVGKVNSEDEIPTTKHHVTA